MLGQHIPTAFELACDELGGDFRYDDELDDNYHVVRFPNLLPFSACFDLRDSLRMLRENYVDCRRERESEDLTTTKAFANRS
jgi:hypothetical protein